MASIITTTGFVSADYGQWPLFSQAILVLLMFVGAYAGFAGGGMKVSRIIIGIKSAIAEMKRMLHPHSVVSVRFEDKYLSSTTSSNIHVYWVLYFFIV